MTRRFFHYHMRFHFLLLQKLWRNGYDFDVTDRVASNCVGGCAAHSSSAAHKHSSSGQSTLNYTISFSYVGFSSERKDKLVLISTSKFSDSMCNDHAIAVDVALFVGPRRNCTLQLQLQEIAAQNCSSWSRFPSGFHCPLNI